LIMNEVFNQSVRFLILTSEQLGMTYQELNVWIFLIIEPIVFAILLIKIYLLTKKLKNYERS
ncbi:hypothetical protein OAQ03_00710, partial [Flavobacteriaceae bacterium]|nr:hypothetical protein [Flavobacteriaceae bacterium]